MYKIKSMPDVRLPPADIEHVRAKKSAIKAMIIDVKTTIGKMYYEKHR